MSNSAHAVLKQIGGTAADMVDFYNERIAARAFERQQAIDNPKPARIAQPLRSYLKRYRNNIAEYLLSPHRKAKRIKAGILN